MVTAGYATDAVKRLYTGVISSISGARGSGIVAAKSGFHSSRNYNRAYHSGDYSIRGWGNDGGPGDAAAAIDVTMSTSNMIKYTKIMINAMYRRDPRVYAVKEIIGTTDGRTVVRYTRDTPTSAPYRASSDSSHLWHQHYSLFRDFSNDWNRLKGIVEVLRGAPAGSISVPTSPTAPSTGSTSSPTTSREAIFDIMLGLKKGDSGDRVKLLQIMLEQSGFDVGTIDGVYGSMTSAAVLKMRRANGSTVTADQGMNPWAVEQLMRAYLWKQTH